MVLPPTLAFLGPMELAVIGLILLVLVFGAKAPGLAAKAGETLGSVDRSKEKVKAEIDELKGTPEAIKEDLGVDEDLKEIEEEVSDLSQALEGEKSSEKQPDAKQS